MESTNAKYLAYKELESDCIRMEEEINRLNEQSKNLQDRLLVMKNIMSGLSSLLNINNNTLNNITVGQTIFLSSDEFTLRDWKKKSFFILKENPNKKYTTPELLDLIVEKSSSLDKSKRRKYMTNLSLAVAQLVENEQIKSNKADGRGNEYYFEKIESAPPENMVGSFNLYG